MKKSLSILFLFACLLIQSFVYANDYDAQAQHLIQTTTNETAKEISVTDFVKKLETLQNQKKVFALKKLYTDDFINSDGFNKTQIFELMNKTFDNYPDIKTMFEIKETTILGNYATVYLNQDVSATTKSASKITEDKGTYSAVLHSILYLKKINNEWKIYSETVTFENSVLSFGSAKGLTATINSPQKVLYDSDYCAGVQVNIPEGMNAIASINNKQITAEFAQKSETFRQIPITNTSLERIFKSNNANHNEAVIASVAFTKQTEDMFKKPKIEISGLLILMKRVDVINKNTNNQKDLNSAKKQ